MKMDVTAEEKALVESFRALDEAERADVLGVQKHLENEMKRGIVSDVGAFYGLIEAGRIPKENDLTPAEMVELAEAINKEHPNQNGTAESVGLLAAGCYAAGYVRGAAAQHKAEQGDGDDITDRAILKAYHEHPEGIRRAVRLALDLENPDPDEVARRKRASMKVINGTKKGADDGDE